MATAYLVVILYVFVVAPIGSVMLPGTRPGGETADTVGLKPTDPKGSYGFDPRLGHQVDALDTIAHGQNSN